ncbi:circadian clock KaiC-like protein [Thermococcus chitonophagus]|uniref:non-specific serine/threonine protein kinase n=1 Tax=Thermococcus chitonophagus TaxID=54262 RepID=A0A160VU18_9EURY|nr:ATPase domain-containing protein [Thermococcus chitonophagus]ASJ16489.1 circadian clock KaiC-like protein [Thermococcus chitonophagus]CUX78512.1 Circadian clock protein KaiC [Thermococcus chitonophagus]
MGKLFGIEYFDKDIIEGGFPDGSVILVAGEPGSGKTIFSATFLYNGFVKFGDKGIYISLSETKREFYEQMKMLGMDFETFEKAGVFKFIDLVTVPAETVQKEIELIMNEIIKFKPDRIVLDSVTVISNLLGREMTRTFLHTMLGRIVKAYNSTAILIAEKPIGKDSIGFGVEEFVVDGVIFLKSRKVGENIVRTIEVRKMRRRRIKRPEYEYAITDYGIEFFAVPELKRAEYEEPIWEKITTGIEKLDKLLEGGIYRGSTVLLVGMTGTGKTTFALHFAISNALQGRRVVYVSFEEPIDQLLRTAQNYGLKIWEALDSGNLILQSWIPEATTPLQLFINIRNLIEEFKPVAVVIDSLSALREHIGDRDISKVLRYLSILAKSKKSALYFTLTDESNSSIVPSTNASTLADVIIWLKYFISEGKLERRLIIVKARGSNHSRKLHKYDITDTGVIIYE